MQGECRVWETQFYRCYAESQPIFCKEPTKNSQHTIKTNWPQSANKPNIIASTLCQENKKEIDL